MCIDEIVSNVYGAPGPLLFESGRVEARSSAHLWRCLLKILYLHPFPVFGGATKSLCELIAAFPAGSVDAVAIAPSGVAAESMRSAGAKVVETRGLPQWDNTRFGYYRGFRWLILMREILLVPSAVSALLRARAIGPFDLIHCNEITALPVGLLAKFLLRAPMLVHVRSLQRDPGSSWITRLVTRLLTKHAAGVVAIDEAVRRSLPLSLDVTIVHNCLRVPTLLDKQPGARDPVFTIGIVGVLSRSKGVYELLEAVRILRAQGRRVRLVIVGENIRNLKGVYGWLLRKLNFAHDVRTDLEEFVKAHDLGSSVEFTGFVSNIKSVYSRLDALCFPSHLDAPGRPVFEAALYGLPSIVAMRRSTVDVVIHGVTGLCISSPEPGLIAEAIETLARDPERAAAMGAEARAHAIQFFDSALCARRIVGIYSAIRAW
jgi:glycosyltransferase involved in cell wall biosynthesis